MMNRMLDMTIEPDTLAQTIAGDSRIVALGNRLHSFSGEAPTDTVSLQDFSVWWSTVSAERDPGVFTRLSFEGGLGLQRQALHASQLQLLRRATLVALILCAAISFCAISLTLGILDLDFEQDDGLRVCANCTEVAAHPYPLIHAVTSLPRKCDISDAARDLHFVLLVVILVPASFMAALIWYATVVACLTGSLISCLSVPCLLCISMLRMHTAFAPMYWS